MPSMYAVSVGVFTKMLTNLAAILDKAEAYAAERKFNPDVLVNQRLAPDMHPLSFQIQNATDHAYPVARFPLGPTTKRPLPTSRPG